MSRTVDVDLSGIPVRLCNLAAEDAERFRGEWPAFTVGKPGVSPLLEVRFECTPSAAPLGGAFRPKEMTSQLTETDARFEMEEASAHVRLDGSADVRWREASGERGWYARLNMVRACLAWILPGHGGALLHAAGLVIDGEAFLLVGPEGSGKSTWARLGREAGGRVLNDDVVIVHGLPDRPVALGAPLRTSYRELDRPGRWPLRALLLSRFAEQAALEEVPSMVARARITANLPFVVEGLQVDPRLRGVVDDLVAAVPCRLLAFAPDAGFVDLLRRL